MLRQIRRIRFLALQCLAALVHSLSDYLDALENVEEEALGDTGLQGNVAAAATERSQGRSSIGGGAELEEPAEDDVSTVAAALLVLGSLQYLTPPSFLPPFALPLCGAGQHVRLRLRCRQYLGWQH